MENLAHSRQPNKPSKKIYGSVGFAPKYDDVFGGQPKFGVQTLSPRVEDYSEIFSSFHASRASSIPVLDLPVIDEAEVSFDVRSSSFDYAEVFGGFDGLDFAVSYEELVFGESKGGDEFSSEEAWNPAGTGSLSEESDHSGKNQCSPHGDSYHLFDERTEFSISNHKATRSSEDFSNMMTHTTQLHDVPGFTCDVDQIPPLQKTEDENPFLQMIDDSNLDMDFSAGAMKGRHLRKTMSHPPNGSAGGQIENDVKSQSGYNKNGYYPNETFISISEISLRTQPSQLPPPSRPPPKKGDSSGLSSNCNANASEGTAGDISPPFFDVEVDATSPAAISAAAMKEAMAKAQAKLKSAKELMERKEGFQSRMRPGSRSGKKDKEEKRGEIVGTDSLKNEGLLAVSDSLEGEKLLNAKKSADEKRGKESRSPQEFVEIGRADEWKEATQFFELVRTDKSRKDFEQANNEKFLVQNTKSHERGRKEKKAAMEAFRPQEDYEKKLKAVAEDHEPEAYEKKLKVIKDNCEREENSGKLKASKGARKHKEHEKKVKLAQEACEREGNENEFKMVQQTVEIEEKLTGADELAKHEKLVELQVQENQIEVEQAIKCKKNGRKVKEANRRIKNEKKLKESCQSEDNGNKQKQAFEQEDEEKPKEILGLAEDEKILKKSLEQEDREKKLREVFEGDENKKRIEAHKREQNEKILKEALEKAENEKRLKEALEQEENEKILKEALEQEENEKRLKEAREREKAEEALKEAHEREEKEKKAKALKEENIKKSLKEACEIEDSSNTVKQVQEKDESELRLKETHEWEVENASKEASKLEETEKPLKDTDEREELKGVKAERDQRLKFSKGTSMHIEVEDARTSNEACKEDDSKNLQATQLACEHEENSGKVAATEEALAHDDRTMRNSGKESEAVEIADVLVDERFKASGMVQGDSEHEENKFRMEDATGSILSPGSMKKVGVAGIGTGQIHVEQRKTTCRKDFDPKNRDRKCSHEWGDCDKNITQAEVAKKLEENKDKFTSTQVVKEWVENGRKTEAAQPAVLEGKRNAQKTAPQVNTNQSFERKEKNLNETLTSEEREIERMKRERELEKERLRKIEEEREREREREKDRMAIDRATLEARESSYTEVRERAERAAMERAISEARQRAMTEARERLERACAEAREKSLIDKAIMEAKLRAERAAVERATAEARERAVEKAMAEKAAAEARERVERSRVRQSSSSSDQQDLQPHSAGPSSGARYPYSSVYGGATYYMERSEGVEGESPQRCKARLERHQRTAERAAKALAEKNMRDLLVLKEQAERNRSAETLDADVRRWSSGKEGNLRALLSTLQYILGPDSGWQPVPLTEVITAAAVKKAYRKATLCVHPDKLQQRGASIHQKYICEKVFDLLKEAWNRFNSEER